MLWAMFLVRQKGQLLLALWGLNYTRTGVCQNTSWAYTRGSQDMRVQVRLCTLRSSGITVMRITSLNGPNTQKYCSFPGCKQSTDEGRIVTPGLGLQQAIWGDKYTDQKLCMTHYSKCYRKVNGPKPCVSCGAHPKSGKTFTRHSPNPQVVNDYNARHELTEHRDIQAQDLICYDCYMLHTEILNIT